MILRQFPSIPLLRPLLCAAVPLLAIDPSQAQTPPPDSAPKPTENTEYTFKAQATFIEQHLFPFHSPYSGPNSLISKNESELSQTYTFFLGKRIDRRLELYLDPEEARGTGVSNTVGLAGYPNGEVVRVGAASDESPYLARYFFRYTAPLGHRTPTEHVPEDENQIAGDRPPRRLMFSVGKMGTNDIFDTNAYANSPRTQFMNWALVNSASYDYAADTRGYSIGAALEYIQPDYAVRIGSFQMPTTANGPDLDADIQTARGDQIELETHPQLLKKQPNAVWRFLAYRNLADMGNYRQAIALGQSTDSAPSIAETRQPGTVKYGFGTSFDQSLADSGKTGLFFRAGWNDGATESFAYTEADLSLSAGLQLSGVHWRAKNDLFAVALAQEGLSAPHRDYLAAGGLGFILGDGRLNYGQERILESYYNHPIGKYTTLGADVQLIENPGYNQDRGPVAVASLRMHFEF